MKKSGRAVKGTKYAEADEEYQKREKKKSLREMRTAGLAKELELSQKQKGYSKMPKLKGQKKNAKPVMGQKKVC